MNGLLAPSAAQTRVLTEPAAIENVPLSTVESWIAVPSLTVLGTLLLKYLTFPLVLMKYSHASEFAKLLSKYEVDPPGAKLLIT